MFGWDEPEAGLRGRVRSPRDRLPDDLRRTAGVKDPDIPFTPVYEITDESAQELANRTVHTVCHLGWVPAAGGGYELRMAALVKPNGLFGRIYMAVIKPFRYLIVYPAMTRRWERAWLDRNRDTVVHEGGGRPAAPPRAW
ncbi:DUF2867 domain-containing protein [Nonomuraea candida]|uniref:DUF2867 domain-containing protein n=1 Tax=Nonomuraea candida TaxID=359159 RepID=UPI000A030E87|nr:DUF2867 domain-containing protein [Nonomuraea candida]